MYNFNKQIENEILALSHLIESYEKELSALEEGYMIKRNTASGAVYYECDKTHSSFLFLGGSDNPRVVEIKRQKFLEKQLPILKRNLSTLQGALLKYIPLSGPSINALLHPVYQIESADAADTALGNTLSTVLNDTTYMTGDDSYEDQAGHITIKINPTEIKHRHIAIDGRV